MTDSEDNYDMSMTRREALAGGSAAAVAAGAALYSDALVRRAKALSAGDARIVMGDQGESPAQNGEITNNSGNVEVYSGGAVRNLTDPTFASLTTDQATINDLSIDLTKSTNQSISADTDKTVDWDNQDVDTDLYTYDTTNDDIDVLKSGDYVVQGSIEWSGVSDGDSLLTKVLTNGSIEKQFRTTAAAAANHTVLTTVTLKDLSPNDTIRFDVRTDASNTVRGAPAATFMSVSRLG